MVEGLLRAYYFQLRLSVDGYAFPHFSTGRDANALACRILVEDTEIGDSYLRHHPTLHTYDLSSFTEQLRALERDGSEQAVLGDPDEESGDEFGLTITLSTPPARSRASSPTRPVPVSGSDRSTSTRPSSPTRSRSSTRSSRRSPVRGDATAD